MHEPILLAHAASTLALGGLVWFVQVVHYPLFGSVGVEAFVGYADGHRRRTTLVVVPLMLVEAVTALTLLVSRPRSELAWLGAALLAAIWISTAALQVPLHRRLSAGFDGAAAGQLVATNWIRTVGWTLRGGIALALLTGGTG